MTILLEMHSEHRSLCPLCPNPKKNGVRALRCSGCSSRIGGKSSLGSARLGHPFPVACIAHKECSLICGVCGKDDKSRAEHEIHVWTHLGQEEKAAMDTPWLCAQCAR